MKSGYKAGPEHPCSMCGLPTRSKFPACTRPGKCRIEYTRLRWREVHGSDLRETLRAEQAAGRAAGKTAVRAAREQRIHPCSLCGRPTASEFPMCARTDRKCNVSHASFRRAHHKERANESARRHRAKQKGESSVYAIWFPVPRVLKIGFTAHANNSIFVSVARTRAGCRQLDTDASSCIWKQPGDVRTEAWIQATLSFRWRAAYEQHHDRLCEWFTVPGLTEDAIVGALNEIYCLVPADMTDSAPAAPLLVTEEQPVTTLF